MNGRVCEVVLYSSRVVLFVQVQDTFICSIFVSNCSVGVQQHAFVWGGVSLSQSCEKRLLASSCLSVRPSVRVEQLGSHWTDIN